MKNSFTRSVEQYQIEFQLCGSALLITAKSQKLRLEGRYTEETLPMKMHGIFEEPKSFYHYIENENTQKMWISPTYFELVIPYHSNYPDFKLISLQLISVNQDFRLQEKIHRYKRKYKKLKEEFSNILWKISKKDQDLSFGKLDLDQNTDTKKKESSSETEQKLNTLLTEYEEVNKQIAVLRQALASQQSQEKPEQEQRMKMIELFSPIEKRECELNDSSPLKLSFRCGEASTKGVSLNKNAQFKKKALKQDCSHVEKEEIKSNKAKKQIEFEEFPNFYFDNGEVLYKNQRIEQLQVMNISSSIRIKQLEQELKEQYQKNEKLQHKLKVLMNDANE